MLDKEGHPVSGLDVRATVSETALVALSPRLTTPAQSYGLTHARYFLPKRLDGAHEAIRAYFALYGSEDPTVCCLPTSTRPANVLAFVPAMGNQGWQATCTNVEIDGPTISDWLPVEMAPKEGGFRH